MSLNSLQTDLSADGDPRWSWRLFLLMTAVWFLLGLAFRVSAVAEGSTTPWTTEVIWRGTNALLWLVFTPPIFFLTRAFPVPGDHRIRNPAIHGLAALGFSVAHLLIFLPVNHWLIPDFPNHYPSLAAFFANQAVYRTVTGVITYGVVFFVFASDAHYRRARQETLRSEELRRQLAEAQLQALRMQIQPHFLFNTLHSISSLIHDAPAEALTMVARLGDFLRAALDRAAVQTLRLEDELKFVELYLDIERVRFGDRLRVSVEVAPDVLACDAPTLILQPLVENAIRHGVAPAIGLVDLRIVAARRGGDLEIFLQNSERNLEPARARSAPTEGLGLSNTRARLQRTYGNRASLAFGSSAPGSFEVTLRMPMGESRSADV